MNLIPDLAPKYFLPCLLVDSSLLLKFTSDIQIPVHSAPISGRTGCEAVLLSPEGGGGNAIYRLYRYVPL